MAPRFRLLLALLVASSAALLALPRTALAQEGATACASATGPDTGSAGVIPPTERMQGPDTAHAAIRLLAWVSASEVRFTGSPKVCVRLRGDAQLDSVRVTGRRNLSSPIVSGTTYRNVYIAVEIIGRLNADCIANRITGTRTDSTSTARCASLTTVRSPRS